MKSLRLFAYPAITFAFLAFLFLGSQSRADEAAQPLAPPAPPTQPQAKLDLLANWLDGQNAITAAHVARLMELANRDSDTAAVLRDALKALSVQNAEQVLPYIRLCDERDHEVLGSATLKATPRYVEKSLAELVGQVKPDHAAKIAKMLRPSEQILETKESSDFIEYLTFTRGSMCMVSKADLLTAVEVFVHELTHLTRLQPSLELDAFLDRYRDADAFTMAQLMRPGDEFEAHYRGFRAKVRLHGGRKALPSDLRDAFNDDGDLIDRDKLVQYILIRQDYGSDYRRNYRQTLISNYNLIAWGQNFLIDVYNDRVRYLDPKYASSVRDGAYASALRLKPEINARRALRARYRPRLAAEGIEVRSASEGGASKR